MKNKGFTVIEVSVAVFTVVIIISSLVLLKLRHDNDESPSQLTPTPISTITNIPSLVPSINPSPTVSSNPTIARFTPTPTINETIVPTGSLAPTNAVAISTPTPSVNLAPTTPPTPTPTPPLPITGLNITRIRPEMDPFLWPVGSFREIYTVFVEGTYSDGRPLDWHKLNFNSEWYDGGIASARCSLTIEGVTYTTNGVFDNGTAGCSFVFDLHPPYSGFESQGIFSATASTSYNRYRTTIGGTSDQFNFENTDTLLVNFSR